MFLQCLREVEALADEAFDDYRAPLIERLLDHAWREVPYIRERMLPFVSDGGFDVDRWSALPLLRSADIAAFGRRATAGTLPADAADSETAPDNTFVPVQCFSTLSRIAAECVRERIYELGGMDSAARLAILHPVHGKREESGTGWSITFPNSSYVSGDTTASPGRQAEWLAQSGCRRLRTTSAIAEALAATDAAPSLETIVIADDALSTELRRRLEARFGARIVHIVERPVIGPIAADPMGNDGCFVPSANMIVEIVDGLGRPVEAGKTGELVVTPLYEYASPLLRLATGLQVVAPSGHGAMLGVRRISAIAEPVSE